MGLIKSITSAKGGDFRVGEAFVIGFEKYLIEALLTPLVGNGNFMSGGVKVAGAVATGKLVKGKMGSQIATAMMIDGVEDTINAVVGRVGFLNFLPQQTTNDGIVRI